MDNNSLARGTQIEQAAYAANPNQDMMQMREMATAALVSGKATPQDVIKSQILTPNEVNAIMQQVRGMQGNGNAMVAESGINPSLAKMK